MRVGDYVRTDIGEIRKVVRVTDDAFILDKDIVYAHKDKIKKSSPNIIDLIEEHDLLKIEYKISDESIQTEVVEVIRNYQGILYVNTFVGKFFVVDLENYNRKILSIVTKEVYDSVKYSVETD